MPDSSESPGAADKTELTLFAVGLVGQLGLMIAVPLVALVLLGAWADRSLGTAPLFLLLGMGLAAATTAVWVLRQARVLKDKYLALFASKGKQPPPL